MTYWNDPIHFSLAMGRAIELEMLGDKAPGAPDNFMVHLTPGNVTAYVESRREGIRRWALQNGDFVAKFNEARQEYELSRSLGSHIAGVSSNFTASELEVKKWTNVRQAEHRNHECSCNHECDPIIELRERLL